MAKQLTQKEYDAIRSDFERRFGYEGRSEKEQADFDKAFDEHYEVKKKGSENTEKGPKQLNEKEYEAIRKDYEKRFGYEGRSEKEQAEFDKAFDERYQLKKKNATGDEDPNDQKDTAEKQPEVERGRRGFREIDDDDER